MLASLFDRHGSDKNTLHSYSVAYEEVFKKMRNVSRLLEIGVKDCASLKAWAEFFPSVDVWGLDCVGFDWPRKIVGDATDPKIISMVPYGFDIIVDDGSHRVQDQLITLGLLWPHLRPGGYYFVEDITEPERFAHLFAFAWHEKVKQDDDNMLILLRGYGPDSMVPAGWVESMMYNGVVNAVGESVEHRITLGLEQVYQARQYLSNEGVSAEDQMVQASMCLDKAMVLLRG